MYVCFSFDFVFFIIESSRGVNGSGSYENDAQKWVDLLWRRIIMFVKEKRVSLLCDFVLSSSLCVSVFCEKLMYLKSDKISLEMNWRTVETASFILKR